jgi:hypothetical protein
MIIGSKLPPEHVDKTYFNSGRAAFSFLLNHIQPQKVYLPTFTCWSLVSTMEDRFPHIPVEYYSIGKDLDCHYPEFVDQDELLVFIHYFGKENTCALPESAGTILEDISHSYASKINHVGDYVFGSYRKLLKVGDGGFINSYFNPIYEESRKLDTWLRYEAKDWRDIREAENMLDRDSKITDISSQSLALLLTANYDLIRYKRQLNDKFLRENIRVGKPLIAYKDTECPLIHNRIFATKEERDSLRSYLAEKGIFTSIHWPTHKNVKESKAEITDTLWLDEHIISFPVSHDYNLNDMEYICACVRQWQDV